MGDRLLQKRLLPRVGTRLAVLAAAALLGALPFAAAQTPATPHASTTAHKTARAHKRAGAAHPQPATVQATPEAVKPPAPKPPNWPANDRPANASVVWDSHGLRIDAENSSLAQILKDVSTATGAKLEGFSSDERVFGAYGPGKARDVLSQLLEGSGYNLLMMGDLGQGAPRQIVLSVRHAGSMQPAAGADQANSSDDDADADDPPQQPTPTPMPTPMRQGFGPSSVPRTPQQIMQEMQQRQQQMQQPNNPQF
ncbi:MAG: hypothetical protein P4K94_02225 [Terracidiphilus sp.]|nr:hypothetical protein [Terracidiphilus sp.]